MEKKGDNESDRVLFSLPHSVLKALEHYSKKEGVKRTVVVRKALVEYLKQKGELEKDKLYL